MARTLTPQDRLLLAAGTPRRVLSIVVVIFAIFLLRQFDSPAEKSLPGNRTATSNSSNTESETFLVKRVVDGDTLQLSDRTRIRLIGINTPEIAHDADEVDQPFGRAATDWLKSQVENKQVRLEYDIERFDQYDRTLAYVYLGDLLINEELVRHGFTRAETKYHYSELMKKRFKKAEAEAKKNNRGIWSRKSR